MARRGREAGLRNLLQNRFFLVAIIPMLSMAFLTFGFLYRERKLAEAKFGVDRAIALSARIESALERHSAELLYLTRSLEWMTVWHATGEEDLQAALSVLAAKVETHARRRPKEIVGFRLLDATGRPMLSWGAWTPTWPGSEANADYFLGALHLAAIRGARAPVHVHHAGGNAPVVYSTLLTDETGAIAGVAAMAVSVRPLLGALAKAGAYRLVGLLDSEGQPIALDMLGPLASRLRQETDRPFLAFDAGVVSIPSLAGRMFAYARIRPLGQTAIKWTAFYEIPLADALAPYHRAAAVSGVIGLGALAIAAVLARSFASQITRPITRLVLAADRLRQGDWGTPLPESEHRNEIDDLIVAFRRMREQIVESQAALRQKIDELRASEAALAAEKERLGVILNGISESVVAVGRDGQIRFANPALETLTGLNLTQLLGRSFRELFRSVKLETGDERDLSSPFRKSLPPGPSVVRVVRQDGEERLLEIVVRHLASPPAPEPVALFVMRDVTEARRLEAERIRVERLQSLGVLAGGIAHDFNNLLGVIVGNLCLLQASTSENSEGARLVRDALQAAERARSLTGQLLAFAKGGAPVKRRASLPEIAAESVRFATRGTPCQHRIEVADGLWSVLADPNQMHQVFHNLARNAVEAMPSGGEIRIAMENCVLPQPDAPDALEPGPYVRIRFRDTGVGVSPEHLPHIFEPYFTTKAHGHGLGLSTVHGILTAHGGAIQVRPADPGTEFVIYIPATTAEVPAGTGSSQRFISGATPALHVLLLEDEDLVAATTLRMLQHLGHRATRTNRGEECLRAFDEAASRGEPYDLLILDLTIRGGMGGADVLRELRQRSCRTPAIAGSGYSQLDVMLHPGKFGFDAVLVKPFTLAQLEEAISRAMSAAS